MKVHTIVWFVSWRMGLQGLVIDTHARVLDIYNQPIKGLYACGNCTTALLPKYPGPGSTLGPAMTFGYLAAKDITGANF